MPILDFSNSPAGAVIISADPEYFADPASGSLVKELMFTSIEIPRSMGYAPDGERLSMA